MPCNFKTPPRKEIDSWENRVCLSVKINYFFLISVLYWSKSNLYSTGQQPCIASRDENSCYRFWSYTNLCCQPPTLDIQQHFKKLNLISLVKHRFLSLLWTLKKGVLKHCKMCAHPCLQQSSKKVIKQLMFNELNVTHKWEYKKWFLSP